MEPRRCGVHGLVVNADGRCVICRRGEPDAALPKVSAELPIVIILATCAVLAVVMGGVWLTRKIQQRTAVAKDAPVTAPVTATPPEPVQDQAAPAPRPMDWTTSRPPLLGEEASAHPTPAQGNTLSGEEVERLKKKVRVTMWRKKVCNLCDQAHGFMLSQGYRLKEIDIEGSDTDRIELESKNPAATVPTFDVEGKILVGYDVNILNSTIEKVALAKRKR